MKKDKHQTQRLFGLPATLLLAACLGCGAGERPITGEVTLDGAALPTGRVSFVPTGKGGTLGAKIEGGLYKVAVDNPIVPGDYAVRITSRQPTGKKIEMPESATGFIEETREVVPDKYNQATELVVKIEAGGERRFDFQLESD